MPNNANIDERVVEMRIDNRQFVSGAEKTISILDKLKNALSFKNAGEGFDDIQKSVDKVDLTGMAADIEAISNRFTTMGLVGMNVIKQLTDTISNFVTSTVKGLTIDPITAGFSKYEEVLKSAKTIMAATREEDYGLKGYAEQIDYVNDQLEILNWFADETSYSLTDMASNIGKFTNAGVELDLAVAEMQGVATWAGLAGASTQEASRAMYNLSQAIAVGSVKLMDWRSIENANMATREFKQTAIDTAVDVGTLTAQIDKYGEVIYKTSKGTVVSAENFNEALSEGWFNSEVLQKTLLKFGEFSRQLNAFMEDADLLGSGVFAGDILAALDKLDAGLEDGTYTFEDWREEIAETTKLPDELVPSIEALEEAYRMLTSAENELGRRAFVASQEYKTFGDVIDATRDAVSTGWSKTFQTIFGDAEQSKSVWKAVGDEFFDIFAAAGDRRNAILKLWSSPEIDKMRNSISGRDSLLSAIGKLYEGIRTYIDPIIEAFDNVFSWGDKYTAADKLIELTEKFSEWTDKVALSEEATRGITVVFEKLFGAVRTGLGVFKPFLKVLGTVIGYVKDFVELFFESFASGEFDSEYFMGGLSGIFASIAESLSAAWHAAQKFIDKLKENTVISTILGVIATAVNRIAAFFGLAREQAGGIIDSFNELGDKPVGILQTLQQLWSNIKESLSGINLDMNSFRELFGRVGEIIATVYEGIVGDPEAFKERIKNTVLIALGGIKEALSSIKISDIFEGAKTGTMMYIALQFAQFVASFKVAAKKFETIPESITNVFESLSSAISSYGKKFQGDYMLKMAAAILAVAVSMLILSKIDQHKFAEVAVTLAFFFIVLGNIAKNISKMSSQFSNNNKFTVNVLPKFAAGLIAIAVLLGVAAVTLLAVSNLGWDQIAKGLTVIAFVLFAAVATLVYLSSKLEDDINVKAISKLIAVGLVIKAAGKAMSSMSEMNWSQIISAGVALGIVIAAVTAAMYAMSKMPAGSAVGSLAGAFSIILVMYTMVPLLLGVTKFIQKYGGEKLISAFVVLGVIGGLVVAFAAIMAKIGNKGGLVKGASALALIGVAFIAFGAALAISAPATLILLNGFVSVMERLSEMKGVGWLVLEMVGLGVALAVISVAAIAFGAAALIAGVGMSLFGAGILAVATAVSLLSVALVPFGMALTEFCTMVAENGSTLISIVAVIITGVIAAIAASRMKIAWTTVLIVLTVIEVIHEYGPQILSVLATVLEDVLKFFITLIPMLIKFLLMAIVTVVDGLANAIRTSADALVSAIENLISAILELFLKVFIQMAGNVLGGLWGLVASMIGMDSEEVDYLTGEIHRGAKMLGDAAADRVGAAFGSAEREASGGATAIIDAFSESFTDGVPKIEGDLTQVMEGVYGKFNENAELSGKNSGESLINSFTEGVAREDAMDALSKLAEQYGGTFDMSGAANVYGQNFAVGNINGIEKRKQDVYDAYYDVSSAGAQGWADAQDIDSPSKLAAKYGGFWTQGIVNGLDDGSREVVSANESLAIKMAEALRNALSTAQILAENDFDLSPTITPVVDMSNVDAAANSVSGMFSGSATSRMGAIGRNMSNLDSVARDMRDLAESRTNLSQDKYEVNIYTQPGMDEEMIADAVIYRLNSGIVRKGAALG